MFNKLIKECRLEKGLTQKELAELTNTTPQNIAHYEKNRRSCTIEQAIEILNSLGVDLLISDGELRRDFRMYTEYYDKNGELIKPHMLLKHIDGDVDFVYKSDDNDLGFNATNRKCKFAYSAISIKLYPLSQFDLKEWEIIKKSDLSEEELSKLTEYELEKAK